MAFNNSFTAVTGATYTAAQYNTHTRDNMAAIWVYTTAGDIAYASSATVLARLALGTAGQQLKVNAGATALEWADALNKGAKVVRATNQTVSSGTPVAASFSSAIFDDSSFWSAGSPTRLTIPATGRYIIIGYVSWTANAGGGFREIVIKRNGTDYLVANSVQVPTVVAGCQENAVCIEQLTAGDYVEMFINQTAAATLDAVGNYIKFWIARVG